MVSPFRLICQLHNGDEVVNDKAIAFSTTNWITGLPTMRTFSFSSNLVARRNHVANPAGFLILDTMRSVRLNNDLP